jgi:hypothetical protein
MRCLFDLTDVALQQVGARFSALNILFGKSQGHREARLTWARKGVLSDRQEQIEFTQYFYGCGEQRQVVETYREIMLIEMALSGDGPAPVIQDGLANINQ